VKKIVSFICLCFILGSLFAQEEKAELYGVVTDKSDGMTLIGVNVIISGTSLGAATGLDGDFRISNINPGEYIIEGSYLGNEKLQ